MSDRMHPEDILFGESLRSPSCPAVDHYAGSEKLIRKALLLQEEIGPYFDITCDCEDGARAGAEAEHARLCAELIAGAENRFGRMGARSTMSPTRTGKPISRYSSPAPASDLHS